MSSIIFEKDQAISIKEKDVQNLQSLINHKEDEIQRLESLLKVKIEDLNNEINRLNEIIDVLHENKADLLKEKTEHITQIEDLRKKLTENGNTREATFLAEISSLNNNILTENNNLKVEIKILYTNLQTYENNISRFRKEKENLVVKIQDQENELVLLKNKDIDSEEKNLEMTVEIQRIKLEINNLKKEYEDYKSSYNQNIFNELNIKEKRIGDLTNEIADLSRSKEVAFEKFENRLKECELENEKLKNDLVNSVVNKIQDCNIERNALINNLENQNTKLSERIRIDSANYETTLEDLKKKGNN